MSSRLSTLVLAAAILPCLALADPALDALPAANKPDKATKSADAELPVVTVSALAIDEDQTQVATPVNIVNAEDLAKKAADTLGAALNGLPGVHADTFGGGASRPVIRGQGAPRVKVLSDSSSLVDASDLSPDHAVTADPLLAQRIEVLRGPATLLYGSGAVGGVVNVLDNKIAVALPYDGHDGSVALRAGSADNERAGAAEISVQTGNHWVLHGEASYRDDDDYQVPDWLHSHAEGTAAQSRNGAFGLSWVGGRGYLGLAFSLRDDGYGLPGHNHEFESCHPDDGVLHCAVHGHDDEHDDAHEHEAPPTVDLLSRRVDLRGELDDPLTGFSRLRLRAGNTRYRHHEIEHDAVVNTFRKDGHEVRLELEHAP